MVCEFSGCRTITKGSHRLEGGSRENFFNNRDLITEPTGEHILPKNFGVVERGDTDQGGRVVVISCGGFPDIVGVEGPEAVGVDGGAVELVAGTVEVAHADLAGAFWTAVTTEYSVMMHISGATVAPRVTPVLLETGLRRRCRCPYRPRESVPSFSP